MAGKGRKDMYEYMMSDKYANTDLNMYHCGMEDCTPGHFYGPAVRDHFLIHYIVKGEGRFQVGERSYFLEAGQGFLICPGIVTYYQADINDPWSYSWVGFNGLKAGEYLRKAGITNENPVFRYDRDDFIKNCLYRMTEAGMETEAKEMRLLGLLYMFLSKLIENADKKRSGAGENGCEKYVRKAVEYIGKNYSRRISIAEIAGYVGLDRSYFYTLAKKYLGISPMEYLTKYRMDRACELLKIDGLTVGDVSRSVGYDDQLQFSKVFKKIRGLSPREFRKQL